MMYQVQLLELGEWQFLSDFILEQFTDENDKHWQVKISTPCKKCMKELKTHKGGHITRHECNDHFIQIITELD